MDLQDLIKKYEIEKNRGKGGDFNDAYLQIPEHKAEEPEMYIRILPGENDADFIKEAAVHAMGDTKYQCPSIKGESCPICELYFSTWKAINAAGKENPMTEPWIDFARKLRAYNRYYINVVDRRDNTVKIWAIGKGVYTTILDCVVDPDFGDGQISPANLEKGWDMRVRMVKKGGYNNYDGCAFRPKQTPAAATQQEINAFLDGRHDLDNLVKYVDNSELLVIAKTKASEFDRLIKETYAKIGGTVVDGDDESTFADSLDDIET